ncbi:MAG: hypothetical protein ACOZQL_10295 [Myxococcota bacterium]
MRTWLCCVLALASGCIVPRSMALGQMAAPVGRGATEVGVYSGVLYASQTNPTFDARDSIGDPIKTTERTAGFTLPSFEANLQHGFSEHVALNVHASSAGLQPGLKWTVNKSKVAHFALMPQVAFGYASLGGSVFTAGVDGVQVEGSPSSKTSFTFLGGLKLLFSHRSGFYAGVGYDFIFNRNFNAAILGGGNVSDKQEIINSTTAHQISASVGMDITLGWFHLRPEIAFGVYPGIAQSRTVNVPPDSTTVGASGGFGWAIFPGFTVAIATPRRELTDDEREEEAEQERRDKRKRRAQGQEEDDDDDEGDDEDQEKRPKLKKKPLDDDEDEDRPKTKRRQREDLDED